MDSKRLKFTRMTKTQIDKGIFIAMIIGSVLLIWRLTVDRNRVLDQEGKYMLAKVVRENRKYWVAEVDNALVKTRLNIPKVDRKKFDDGYVFYIPIKWVKFFSSDGTFDAFYDQACRSPRPEMIDSVWDEPTDICLDSLPPEQE